MVSHLHPWPIQLINKQMILHSTFVDLCWPLPCVKHWPPFCKHSSTMSLRQRCTVKSSRRSCSWRMHIQIKRCLNFTSQYCRYPFSLEYCQKIFPKIKIKRASMRKYIVELRKAWKGALQTAYKNKGETAIFAACQVSYHGWLSQTWRLSYCARTREL